MVDDHRLFAEAMALTLSGAGMTVVGIATNAAEGHDEARDKRPDLVLVDIGLPDRDGIELGREILVDLPETKVVALTAHEEPAIVRDAEAAGFHGYLTKTTEPDRFTKALEIVADGNTVFPDRVDRSKRTAPGQVQLMTDQLTARELEVLELLAEGATSREIALRLEVSANTVRTHVQSVLTKLQVHSRLEAAAFAVKHGIVRPRP